MSTLQHITTLRGHEEDTRVWHAAWSNNGKFLATCGEDKTIRIWTTSLGGDWTDENSRIECIATLEEAQARTVRSCEWSPDDRMIASASFDGTVVVWETQSSGMTVWDQIATLEGHDNEVKSVAWCPHGQWLATCGRDKRVWIWEMLHGTEFECVAMLEGHTQDVKFVRWHPTAPAMLLSASYDDTIKIWKEDSDDWYCADTLSGHTGTVWGLTFDIKGSKFISCSDDKSLIEWHCDGLHGSGTWRIIAKIKDLHELPIYTVDWSYVHGYVATGSGDNAIALCSPSCGDGSNENDMLLHELTRVSEAHENDINCVRWNPVEEYGSLLVSTGDDGVVKLWRLMIH